MNKNINNEQTRREFLKKIIHGPGCLRRMLTALIDKLFNHTCLQLFIDNNKKTCF